MSAPGVARAPAADSSPAPGAIPLLFPSDADIERRLAGIYAQVDGLGKVRIRAREGVVHLSGPVTTAGTVDNVDPATLDLP